MSMYTFERTECYSNEFPVPAFRVHSAAPECCGHEFHDCALILEPDSENPCLVLRRPLGIQGVQRILDQLKENK